MTSPRSQDPHAAVLVTEPVRASLQRIPGRSHAKRVLPCGRTLYPVQVALLAAVSFGAAKLGLTMTFVASGRAIWRTVGGYPHSWHPEPSIEGRFDERMRNVAGESSPPSQILNRPTQRPCVPSARPSVCSVLVTQTIAQRESPGLALPGFNGEALTNTQLRPAIAIVAGVLGLLTLCVFGLRFACTPPDLSAIHRVGAASHGADGYCWAKRPREQEAKRLLNVEL